MSENDPAARFDWELNSNGVDVGKHVLVENRTVVMQTAISHGDLHGDNVLVDSHVGDGF